MADHNIDDDIATNADADQEAARRSAAYAGQRQRWRDALLAKRTPPLSLDPVERAQAMRAQANRLVLTAIGASVLLVTPVAMGLLVYSGGALAENGVPVLVPLASAVAVIVVAVLRVLTRPRRT